ncbi:threonine/serine exporter family protein [Actinoplanes sp. KI2]|uniref:threonine/serine ThrE exporter family protein n=1 Tax=Actinoplanes sp. KI2 TaxID=2983315 RepID=UPI0021D5BA9B|nr:threonine/serine exporter family protein [Actinoplanes sp. KI2]MCU7725040.1 threonine/serine exporter family protein [Actinoplanes sp. KI2]
MTEPGTAEQDRQQVQQFLLDLGSALTASGEAVNRIEDHLHHLAVSYGNPQARVSVLPTYVAISMEPGRPAVLESTRRLAGHLRLDQTAAVFEVLKAAVYGRISPAEGSLRIQAIGRMAPRFRPTVSVLGHVVLTVGICLLLAPTWGDLVLAGLFGAFVGWLKLLARRWASIRMILPAAAAFAVGAVTFLVVGRGWAPGDLRAMIPPLVTFLPGAMLTMAVVEISAAEIVSGASRLVAGGLQLLLLTFGIIGAAHVVGLPSPERLAASGGHELGWWAPWLGVLVIAFGDYLHHSAPRGALRWLCLVLYVAWVGQFLGDQVFGGYLSGFIGAIVMTPVACLVERRPSGPPALVSFMPAFWLLVPGALSVIGVTKYLGRGDPAGAQEFVSAVGSMIAVALGVLCGYPLYRALARGRATLAHHRFA